MATVASIAEVQQAYVAYYGRPADPEGLDYWADRVDSEGGIENLISSFGNSAEASARFGSLSSDAAIEAIYQQIFGRAAEAEGKAFYLSGLLSGQFTLVSLARDIAGGATGTDAVVLANKLSVAQAFTDAIDTDSEQALYSGNTAAANARTWLDSVDSTSASATAATSSLDETIQSLQGETNASTFSLTTDTEDDLVGTDNNDAFNATTRNLTVNDQVDGGSGTDVLNLTVLGDLAAASVDDIEIINVDIQSIAEPDLDFTNFGGAPEVVISRTITGMSDSVVVTAGGGDFTYTVGEGIDELELDAYDEGIINTGTELTTLTIDAAAELNLNLDGTQEITLAGTGAITDATITAVAATGAVDVTGNADFTGDLNLVGAVTITGDSNIFDGGTITGANATLVFDASTAGAISMEDISVANIEIDTAATIAVTEAQGNTFTITEDGADFTADTGTDGGTFEVIVDAGTSTVVVNAANADSATVTYTADAEDSTSLTIGTTTNVVTEGDHEFAAIAEAAATNLLVISGSGDVEIADLQVTSTDATLFAGNLDITVEETGDHSIDLGSGNDVITSAAGAVGEGSYNGGDGDDVVEAEGRAGAAGDIVFSGGNGNDELDLGAMIGALGTIIFLGGDGDDSISVDTTAAVDLTTTTAFIIDSVEALTFAGAGGLTIDASTLNGQTITVSGSATAGETLTIVTAATDSAIDLSGVSVNSTVDTIEVDLSTMGTAANSYIGSAASEVVTAIGTGTSFSMDLGAGDDVLTLDNGGIDGSITLGDGSDTVVLVAGAGLLAAANLVTITDFNNDEDVLITTIHPADIAPDIAISAAVDVSAATTATDEIFATVSDGMISLLGDSANVNTLAEWDAVVDAMAVADGGNGHIYGFEFDGDTYVVETNATVVTTAIQLEGVTGLTLTADGSSTELTLARTLDAIVGSAAGESITGTANADTIDGAGGTDTISGGDGDDVLTGGAGADTFLYRADDDTTVDGSAVESITDYELGTDILDFDTTADGATTPDAAQVTAEPGAFDANGFVTGNLALAVADAATLAAAIIAITGSDESGNGFDFVDDDVFGFVYGGDTYIGHADADGALGNLVRLIGVEGDTLTATNDTFIVS